MATDGDMDGEREELVTVRGGLFDGLKLTRYEAAEFMRRREALNYVLTMPMFGPTTIEYSQALAKLRDVHYGH